MADVALRDVGLGAMAADPEKIHSGFQSIKNLTFDRGKTWYHVDTELGPIETFFCRTQHLDLRHETFAHLQRGCP